MNCREFEASWNELLDARSVPLDDFERELEAHASACSRCQVVNERYQVFRLAVASLTPPTASADSIERLRGLMMASIPEVMPIVPSKARPRRRAPLLAAAAAFAMAWLGGDWWPVRQPTEPGLGRSSALNRSLGLALAEATEATLDLAIEVSVPASRIGREMLDLGKSSSPPLDIASEFLEEEPTEPPIDPDSSATDLFRTVGERMGAGVKPISGSARYAFSFLLGPPAEPGQGPPRQRDSL